MVFKSCRYNQPLFVREWMILISLFSHDLWSLNPVDTTNLFLWEKIVCLGWPMGSDNQPLSVRENCLFGLTYGIRQLVLAFICDNDLWDQTACFGVYLWQSTVCKIWQDIFLTEAQWLSGRVLDSRPRGRGCKPHQRHCIVSLSKIP